MAFYQCAPCQRVYVIEPAEQQHCCPRCQKVMEPVNAGQVAELLREPHHAPHASPSQSG